MTNFFFIGCKGSAKVVKYGILRRVYEVKLIMNFGFSSVLKITYHLLMNINSIEAYLLRKKLIESFTKNNFGCFLNKP